MAALIGFSGILRRYHSTCPNGLPVDHRGYVLPAQVPAGYNATATPIPGAMPGNVSSPDVK